MSRGILLSVLLVFLLIWLLLAGSGERFGFDAESVPVVITVSDSIAVAPSPGLEGEDGLLEEGEGDLIPDVEIPPGGLVPVALGPTCTVSPNLVEVEARGPWWKGPLGWCKAGPCKVSWSLVNNTGDELVAQVTAKIASEQGECRPPTAVAGCPDPAHGQRIRDRFDAGAPPIGPILDGIPQERRPRRAGNAFRDEAPRDGSPDMIHSQQYSWWYWVEVSEPMTNSDGETVFDPDNIVCRIDPKVCVRKNGQMVCQDI